MQSIGTISVIVPVYNAAAGLHRCLDALLAQTYADLQIILVDDGSTDASPRLCDEAAAADTRVVVIHRENGGPPAARNAGLDAVSGSWTAFVDADDAIAVDYLAHVVHVAQQTGADLVMSDCIVREAGAERKFGMVVPDMLYETRDDLWQDFLSARVPWSMWAKLYRSELFANIRFNPTDYIAEDLDVNARIFARDGLRVATTDNAGYIYSIAPGSVDSGFSDRHLCQLDVYERVVQLACDEGIVTQATPQVFYERRVLGCLEKALAAGPLTERAKAEFARAIALHRSEALADRGAPLSLKLRLHATRLGLNAYARLSRLLRR